MRVSEDPSFGDWVNSNFVLLTICTNKVIGTWDARNLCDVILNSRLFGCDLDYVLCPLIIFNLIQIKSSFNIHVHANFIEYHNPNYVLYVPIIFDLIKMKSSFNIHVHTKMSHFIINFRVFYISFIHSLLIFAYPTLFSTKNIMNP